MSPVIVIYKEDEKHSIGREVFADKRQAMAWVDEVLDRPATHRIVDTDLDDDWEYADRVTDSRDPLLAGLREAMEDELPHCYCGETIDDTNPAGECADCGADVCADCGVVCPDCDNIICGDCETANLCGDCLYENAGDEDRLAMDAERRQAAMEEKADLDRDDQIDREMEARIEKERNDA